MLPSGGVGDRVKQGNGHLHTRDLQIPLAVEKEQKFNIGVTVPGMVPEGIGVIKLLAKAQNRPAVVNNVKIMLHFRSALSFLLNRS